MSRINKTIISFLILLIITASLLSAGRVVEAFGIPVTDSGTQGILNVIVSILNKSKQVQTKSETQLKKLNKKAKKEIEKTEEVKEQVLESGVAEIVNDQEIDQQVALREVLWQQFKDAIVKGWVKMQKAFVQQLARDTATMIASGGQGQQPLFMTEGWGNYLTDLTDQAAGAFITELNDRWGVDLCEPDFQFKALIKTNLHREKTEIDCTFSEMAGNWEDAINDASYSVKYANSFTAGGNELSILLKTESGLKDKISQEMLSGILKVDADGYKPLEDLAGWVLTPGSSFKEAWRDAQEEQPESDSDRDASLTVWDFIEPFLNTLAAAMLEDLEGGIYGGGSGSSGSSSGSAGGTLGSLGSAIRGLSRVSSRSTALSNPYSSPYYEGKVGAQIRYSNLVAAEPVSGGNYDILVELKQCPPSHVANPEPDQCVIDELFSQQIWDKKLVKNLPDTILNRPFVPNINQVTNPQEAFTLRNIIILRKYRIVPIGWEIAARYIDKYGSDLNESYTLGDLISAYDYQSDDNPFKGLVDPDWVLKVPELFCRREGFGPHNLFADQQNNTIARSKYCADEQQCIREEDDGDCTAYGYCTEEERIWNFNGTKCPPKYNTCQTYETRQGSTISYLSNTLDSEFCNLDNAGCIWLSNLYNDATNDWLHTFVGEDDTGAENTQVLITCNTDGGCPATATSDIVQTGHNVNTNNTIIMTEACTLDSGCNFNGQTCTIPKGEIKCLLDSCGLGADLMLAANGDFEAGGEYSPIFSDNQEYDAFYWDEAYIDGNNRHGRSYQQGVNDSFAMLLLSNNNIGSFVTRSLPINVVPDTEYELEFAMRGEILEGNITVRVMSGESVLVNYQTDNDFADWQTRRIVFVTTENDEIRIELITENQTTAEFYLDNMKLVELNPDCESDRVYLTLGTTAQNNADIYFDRDAQTCDSQAAGCSQFIITRAESGSNLLVNGDFESETGGNADYWLKRGQATGMSQLPLTGELAAFPGGLYSAVLDKTVTDTWVMASSTKPITLLENHKYVLSGWVYSQTYSPDLEVFIDWGDVYAGAADQDNSNLYTREGEPQLLTSSYLVPNTGSFVRTVRPRIVVRGAGANTVYFDNLKVEEIDLIANSPSGFTPYDIERRESSQLTYLKKAPAYYNCYGTSGWPMNEQELAAVLDQQSPACSDYAQVCIPAEVGCQEYQPLNGDPAIPGIYGRNNICPTTCVGYQSYLQAETDFASARKANFIANDKPIYCSAQQAGCDEFTNLDEVAQGGEGRAYFTQAKPCQEESGSVYYTFEGHNLTGYQLQAYNLKPTDRTDLGGPCTNLAYYHDDVANAGDNYCVDPKVINTQVVATDKEYTLFSLLNSAGFARLDDYLDYTATNDITQRAIINPAIIQELHKFGLCLRQELRGYYHDAGTQADFADDVIVVPNQDCREFYDTTGQVSYRLLSRTISSSADCHPYRRTPTQDYLTQADKTADPNADPNATVAELDCKAKQGYWNSYNECIYMLDPIQARTCTAEVVGCRQYSGARGNNHRTAFLSQFEAGLVDFWQGGSITSEAIHPGDYSLTISSAASASADLTRTVFLNQGSSYLLSFWAKGDVDFTLDSIKFSSAGPDNYFADLDVATVHIPSVEINGDNWVRYDLGPIYVDWEFEGDQSLVITVPSGNRTLYIDTVHLKEIPNNTFLLENTWETPVECDNTIDNPYGSGGVSNPTRDDYGHMLGCATYRDQIGDFKQLTGFDHLCRPEAIGCEMLIDTHNSRSVDQEVFHAGETSEVVVPADNYIFLVNNPEKAGCFADQKGCQAFGLPLMNQYDEVYDYSTLYLRNLPDRYDRDLCHYRELWCEEFYTGSVTDYFKDPRSKLCEYNDNDSTWYKLNTNDPCSISYSQTIGTGIRVDKEQPVGWFQNYYDENEDEFTGWAGLCPTAYTTCSEIIDPNTANYKNLIFNSDFSQSANDIEPDGWSATAGYTGDKVSYAEQEIAIGSHTLYNASFKGVGSLSFEVDCGGGSVIYYSPDNSVTFSGNVGTISSTEVAGNSGSFYVDSDGLSCLVKVIVDAETGSLMDDIRVVKAGVYYYLKNSLGNKTCEVYNPDDGCVLFNDRSYLDYSVASVDRATSYLYFDAYTSQPGVGPAASSQGPNNTNVILKTQPDRQCATWLYCLSHKEGDPSTFDPVYGTTDQCLELGLCSSLNDKGECNRFVYSDRVAEVGYADNSNDLIANKTGYTALGKDFGDLINGEPTIVDGMWPYDLMEQIGGTANIANHDFELVAGDTTRPLGWQTVDQPDGQPYVYDYHQEPGWYEYKFSSVKDINNSREGSRYLRLNSFYEAESEQIDVEPNQDYYLSVWVNTMDLQHATSSPRANVLIKQGDGNYYSPNDLRLPAGMGWTLLTHKLTTGDDVNHIKIKFSNYVNERGCGKGVDNDPSTQESSSILEQRYRPRIKCSLSGYSRFDQINIRPVLKVNEGETDFLARSCRIYPAQDAMSCSYMKGSNLFYGQYGYCLTRDPNNYQQCLQWWPVDHIEGEIVEEASVGYDDRTPLYYCTKKAKISFPIIANEMQIKDLGDWEFGGMLSGGRSGMNLDGLRSGVYDVDFVPFEVPEEFQIVFRYPYVKKFTFMGMHDMIGLNKVIYLGLPFSCDMYKDGYYFRPFDLSVLLNLGIFGGEGGEGGFSLPGICAGNCTESDATIADVLGEVVTTGATDILDSIGSGVIDWVAQLLLPQVQPACDPECGPGYECVGGDCQLISPDDEEEDGGIVARAINRLIGSVEGIAERIFSGGLGDGFASVSYLGVQEFAGSPLALMDQPDFETEQGFNLQFNPEKDTWGGFGGIPLAMQVDDNLGISIIIPISWDLMINIKNVQPYLELLGIGGAFGDATELLGGAMNNFGVKVVTDQDPEFANMGSDPMPDMDGDILGFVWFLDNAGTIATTLIGKFRNEIEIEYCDEVVEVVTAIGSNRAFAARASRGSGYVNFDLLSKNFKYLYHDTYDYQKLFRDPLYQASDYRPYGSVVPPSGTADSPTNWDSKEEVPYNQPLFYEPPLPQEEAPGQPRMGELHMVAGIKQLFAKSYGVWHWQWRDITQDWRMGGNYLPGEANIRLTDLPELWEIISNPLELESWETTITSINALLGGNASWDLPTDYCIPNVRDNSLIDQINDSPGLVASLLPTLTDPTELLGTSYCLVRPTISNIKINNTTLDSELANTQIQGVGSARLEFNVAVDPDQMPLTSYAVDWGDGSKTSVAGAKLRSYENEDNPFILYHWYDYWKIKQENENGDPNNLIRCTGDGSIVGTLLNIAPAGSDTCLVKVIITARDNWLANAEETIEGWVKVTEK